MMGDTLKGRPCGYCQAPIVFVRSRTGAAHVLDAKARWGRPVEVLDDPAGPRVTLVTAQGEVLTHLVPCESIDTRGQIGRESHWASCPNAAEARAAQTRRRACRDLWAEVQQLDATIEAAPTGPVVRRRDGRPLGDRRIHLGGLVSQVRRALDLPDGQWDHAAWELWAGLRT